MIAMLYSAGVQRSYHVRNFLAVRSERIKISSTYFYSLRSDHYSLPRANVTCHLIHQF